jgi:hypothetical protein
VDPSRQNDWSTHGFTKPQHVAPPWYLAFNLVAWAMQVFVGYSALLLLIGSTVVLGAVFRTGIGGKPIKLLFGSRTQDDVYQRKWKCTARCGLEGIDPVFLVYTLVATIALAAAAVSIHSKIIKFHEIDTGAWVLAFLSLLFLPLSAFLVYFPYFTNFPRTPIPECKDVANAVDPNPWPFGSDNIGRGLLALVVGVLLFLLYLVFGK